MDGLDVVKSVKHMRPDIDVVVITGYATVETAVEGMNMERWITCRNRLRKMNCLRS